MDEKFKLADNLINLYRNMVFSIENVITMLVYDNTNVGEVISFNNEFGFYADGIKVTGIYCEFDHRKTIFVVTSDGKHLPLSIIRFNNILEILIRLREGDYKIIKK